MCVAGRIAAQRRRARCRCESGRPGRAG
jgi:hypothetical protein